MRGDNAGMHPNPYDPAKRTDLSLRQRILLQFTGEVIHGTNIALIDEVVASDYIQHTHGAGQGREGIRRYVTEIASRRPDRAQWRPILIFEDGDFVILYKLLRASMIVDIVRFNEKNQLAEHWDIVQPLPSPDYDPMALSSENFERFYSLFGLKK
jgi:predicted SnoaL-like aldol condensation-catalyzing enzyme